MGNVRLSYFKNSNGSAEVLEENSYYPFGLRHDTNILSVNNSSYKYQYNGKEYQTETGWSDYGARMYMSDIARWGVIDPLSETSRRFSTYNYAYNNPISFVDPDGRKAMAVDEGWSWNVPTSSGWFNERRNFGSFDEFIKLTSSKEKERGSAGGGSSTTIGDIMRSVGVDMDGSLNSYMQMIGTLNLRQQLIDAGFNPDSKTSYKDLGKLLVGVSSLTELYEITDAEFIKDDKGKHPAETVGKYVYLTMSKIDNLLFFAYTLGHEMNHVFDNRFFQDKFIEITKFGDKSSIPFRNAFGLYKESNGLGWEMQFGNSKLCGLTGFEAASFYYGPKGWGMYDQNTVDKLSPYINQLNRARSIIYNTKKNDLK